MLRFYFTVLLAVLLTVPLLVPSNQAAAAGSGEAFTAQDLLEIQEYIDRLDTEIKSAVPQVHFREMVNKLVKGELEWQPSQIFNQLVKQLFKEVVANFDLLGKLVVLAVICAVLQNLMTSFANSSAGQLTYSVTYLVLITLAIGSFTIAVNAGREVVDTMVTFMQALTPVLLTLLVAVGGLASAAIFSPVILATLSIFGTLIKDIVLPLLFFVAILGIVGNLSEQFKVSNLANLLKTVAMGLMGLFSTIFLGVLAIQGVAGAVGDSVTFRTAKFSVDAFVPVVGGMLSDALEAVISSSLLLKNAVGIAGMAVIGTVMVIPLLKIITLAFIYKLAGALIQPIGSGQMVDCLNTLGNNLLLIFATVATAGLLFFFTITIVVGVGNISVMLR
ncbi:MAG TPA: stage III sporulation protein AE [Bacillota bacterium]|nr:stage III sporulation protein AE [Peptococcaceae bacterium MAG4]NLW38859.1 stage III sporulation protein AE [Peptococcaceae bacterium]HPU35900.1 stage III sporulation protein AE [Bacillota bacterium]HPZ42528.1 stage III sporulation protein AE [Bacillota bacterium]HQD76153.1 stage III sporulation protein AE [Bacillota bacterium]